MRKWSRVRVETKQSIVIQLRLRDSDKSAGILHPLEGLREKLARTDPRERAR